MQINLTELVARTLRWQAVSFRCRAVVRYAKSLYPFWLYIYIKLCDTYLQPSAMGAPQCATKRQTYIFNLLKVFFFTRFTKWIFFCMYSTSMVKSLCSWNNLWELEFVHVLAKQDKLHNSEAFAISVECLHTAKWWKYGCDWNPIHVS